VHYKCLSIFLLNFNVILHLFQLDSISFQNLPQNYLLLQTAIASQEYLNHRPGFLQYLGPHANYHFSKTIMAWNEVDYQFPM